MPHWEDGFPVDVKMLTSRRPRGPQILVRSPFNHGSGRPPGPHFTWRIQWIVKSFIPLPSRSTPTF